MVSQRDFLEEQDDDMGDVVYKWLKEEYNNEYGKGIV
jgi:hypothetical protein